MLFKNKVKRVLAVMDEALLNEILYNYAITKINFFLKNGKVNFNIIGNQIHGKCQDSVNNFSISFEPSLRNLKRIVMSSEENGIKEEKKIISFEDAKTIMISEEAKTIHLGIVKEISHSAIYTNNKLVYQYQTKQEIFNLNSINNYIKSKEVYVAWDNSAAIKEICIADKKIYTPAIQYFYRDYYDVTNYDTRVTNSLPFLSTKENSINEYSTKDEFDRRVEKVPENIKILANKIKFSK